MRQIDAASVATVGGADTTGTEAHVTAGLEGLLALADDLKGRSSACGGRSAVEEKRRVEARAETTPGP